MELRFKLLFILFITVIFFADLLSVQKKSIVRVLLQTMDSGAHWKLESSHGFVVWDNANPDDRMHSNAKCCSFYYKKSALFCNKKKVIPEVLCIAPEEGHITFNGKRYQGTFLIINTGKKVLLINCLDIEDYVFSVLKTESWPGWPLEINKVFAIASRSYVMSMAQQAKKSKQLYDVKNSNVHQTYTGVHECKTIKKAVEQTKGVFLAYKKRPIIAMFDSCCGGIIPAHMADVNFVDAPYLARTKACHYCKSCSLYTWKHAYNIRHLEDHVSKIHGRIKRLRNFTITQRDKAGIVKEVHVNNGTKPLILTGQQVYSLLKEVKSFSFKIYRKGDDIFFEGNGLGHHLGLCQWGARQMVRDGFDYKQILQFYYPQTTFMKLH